MTLLLIIFFSYVHASDVVVVGCATKCDSFFKRALTIASKRLNVRYELTDLSNTQIPLSEVDALIFPGGADIDPEYYLDKVDKELHDYTRALMHLVKFSEEGKRRDPIEYNLLQEYFSNEDLKHLPVLGVCRGMQMLAVSQGIPLYVDINHELGIRNRRYLFDKIFMVQDSSLMNDLFGNIPFWAFKRHHQGVRVDYFKKNKVKWPDIELTSFSNNGMIAESLEFKNRPVLGVQFHPENDFGFERTRIFSWLLSKAKERSRLKIESGY